MSSKNIASDGYNELFPTRLRQLMDKTGKTQAGIAKAIGTTRQAVSGYCTGITLPDIKKLVAIADFFHVQPNYFLVEREPESFDHTYRAACIDTGLHEMTVRLLENIVKAAYASEQEGPLVGNDRKHFESYIKAIDAVINMRDGRYDTDGKSPLHAMAALMERYAVLNAEMEAVINEAEGDTIALRNMYLAVREGGSWDAQKDSPYSGQNINYPGLAELELWEFRIVEQLKDFVAAFFRDIKQQHEELAAKMAVMLPTAITGGYLQNENRIKGMGWSRGQHNKAR